MNCCLQLGNAMYGLRCMELSGGSEMSHGLPLLLRALSHKLLKVKSLDPMHAVSMIMYGMNGLESSCPEVRSLVAALVEKLPLLRGGLDAQGVGKNEHVLT